MSVVMIAMHAISKTTQGSEYSSLLVSIIGYVPVILICLCVA